MSELPVRRRCRQCGNPFLAIRHDQAFCQQRCRRAWHSWRETRGAQAIELLIRWRRDRRRGSLGDLTAFADDLLREHRDREADRQAAGKGYAETREGASGIQIPAKPLSRVSERPALSVRTLPADNTGSMPSS